LAEGADRRRDSQFLHITLGNKSEDEIELQKKWHALVSELIRLSSLRPTSTKLPLSQPRSNDQVLRSGPSAFARRPLKSTTTRSCLRLEGSHGMALCGRALDSIDVHHQLRNLFEERRKHTSSLARTYQELVAEKCWLNVFNNSPDSVQQDLKRYLNAIQAMGTGLGLRAVRYRRDAQEAMTRAYRAVPCWVLPQWRVSETIRPRSGFSTSSSLTRRPSRTIWALPVLLRGKKLLIVGDRKQVSPSAIGMAEQRNHRPDKPLPVESALRFRDDP